METEYVWWAEDHSFFNSQIFSSLDEVLKSAGDEYQRAEPILDTEYFSYNYDQDTDTEELSPIVLIGEVQRLDIEDMVKYLFNSIKDAALDYHSDFSVHCDIDPEFDTDKDSDTALKVAIRKWLEDASLSPTAIANPLYEYNCSNGNLNKIY